MLDSAHILHSNFLPSHIVRGFESFDRPTTWFSLVLPCGFNLDCDGDLINATVSGVSHPPGNLVM